MEITEWNIQNETGYEPKTTYYMDFGIAERFGKDAIIDTLKRAFNEHKENIEIITELAMVLNWKSWEHYNKHNSNMCQLYVNLYNELDNYIFENYTKEEISYYVRTTD